MNVVECTDKCESRCEGRLAKLNADWNKKIYVVSDSFEAIMSTVTYVRSCVFCYLKDLKGKKDRSHDEICEYVKLLSLKQDII